MKTDARFTRRLFLPVLWSAILAFSPLQLSAAEPTVPVPLQQAVDAGDLEVIAIPRDSRQLVVQLINRSDEEIVVAAPAVLEGNNNIDLDSFEILVKILQQMASFVSLFFL